jgi:hypothetical protein
LGREIWGHQPKEQQQQEFKSTSKWLLHALKRYPYKDGEGAKDYARRLQGHLKNAQAKNPRLRIWAVKTILNRTRELEKKPLRSPMPGTRSPGA